MNNTSERVEAQTEREHTTEWVYGALCEAYPDEVCSLGHGVPIHRLNNRLELCRKSINEHLNELREQGRVERVIAMGESGPGQHGYRPTGIRVGGHGGDS